MLSVIYAQCDLAILILKVQCILNISIVQVKFTQLVGKRILLFFEGDEEEQEDFQKKWEVKFLNLLKESYLIMKGMSDEFEVIYITSSKNESSYDERIASMPWFVSPASQLLPIDLSSYCCYCHHLSGPSFLKCRCREWRLRSSLLAFDRDGIVVRKSIDIAFEDHNFPFYAGSMEEEAFNELNYFYQWFEMDMYYCGIMINPYYNVVNRPTSL